MQVLGGDLEAQVSLSLEAIGSCALEGEGESQGGGEALKGAPEGAPGRPCRGPSASSTHQHSQASGTRQHVVFTSQTTLPSMPRPPKNMATFFFSDALQAGICACALPNEGVAMQMNRRKFSQSERGNSF